MNSNFVIFIAALVPVLILSIAWNIIYMRYLRRKGFAPNNKLLGAIEPDFSGADMTVICPVVLPNTDDDVSEALEYIECAEYVSDLLGNLYEQAGI